jgi:N-acetylmuramoyl-L-alanine amidase
MRIVISSGHGKLIRGASGYLDEVNEARRVVEQVATELRSLGVQVDTFHDDVSKTQSENLKRIVDYHNSRPKHEYDLSVHFNAYKTTSSPMGTETLYLTQQALASKASAAIAAAGKLINRGGKKRTDLYFLNNTRMPALLYEIAFVDSLADANLYRDPANFSAICRAIAETISGRQVPVEPEAPVEPELPAPGSRVDIMAAVRGAVAVTVNGELLAGSADSDHVVDLDIFREGDVLVTINGEEFHNFPDESGPSKPAPIPENQTNIICTVFGGSKDPNSSAYPPYDKITDTELSVALPFRFVDRPDVRVINRANGHDVVCRIRDIGPWLTDDPYWETGARPLAETCYKNSQPLPRGPNKGKIPNGAGIDITPSAAKAIGLSGKGNVDWEFV